MLVWALAFILSGTVCMFASVTKRWIVEWVGSFFLLGAISIYLVQAGIRLARGDWDLLTITAVVTMLATFVVIRAIDLTVFYRQVERAKKVEWRFFRDR